MPEKLEAAAAIGFDGVEIFENDLLTFDGTPADVRHIAEDLGLAITMFQPSRDFEAMPEPQRARNLDRTEKKCDVMAAVGTDLLLVCSNVQAAVIHDPTRAAADLREMAERAKRRSLRIGYEALAWGRQVNRWRQAGTSCNAPSTPRSDSFWIVSTPWCWMTILPPSHPCPPKKSSSSNSPMPRA